MEIGAAALIEIPQEARGVVSAKSLGELLADDSLDLISLCSPRRADQAEDAIRCLAAGKHVYAEKPCALNERDLDRILETASRFDRSFRETAGTAFAQPWRAMRDAIAAGKIGGVAQVFAQKSYPYHANRPDDEDIDGGLTLQAGIHAVRMIEQVSGLRLKTLSAREIQLAGFSRGGLRMAAELSGTLENGALACALVNYLNPRGTGVWGNDHLRIFGTKGMIESVDGGTSARLFAGVDLGMVVAQATPSLDYFLIYARSLLGAAEMLLPLEEEMHSLRMLLRAKQALIARPGGAHD
ncbi:MAG: Gfo/Idh/MocA family oxidoreductase [Chthoniobacterales bacterium]